MLLNDLEEIMFVERLGNDDSRTRRYDTDPTRSDDARRRSHGDDRNHPPRLRLSDYSTPQPTADRPFINAIIKHRIEQYMKSKVISGYSNWTILSLLVTTLFVRWLPNIAQSDSNGNPVPNIKKDRCSADFIKQRIAQDAFVIHGSDQSAALQSYADYAVNLTTILNQFTPEEQEEVFYGEN